MEGTTKTSLPPTGVRLTTFVCPWTDQFRTMSRTVLQTHQTGNICSCSFETIQSPWLFHFLLQWWCFWFVVLIISTGQCTGSVFCVIFPHTLGTMIEVVGPLTVTFSDRPDPVAFMPVTVDTSGRIYDDFIISACSS
jgi:hypothetical protein